MSSGWRLIRIYHEVLKQLLTGLDERHACARPNAQEDDDAGYPEHHGDATRTRLCGMDISSRYVTSLALRCRAW